MLDAIRNARETITMECYIFKKGEIGDQFIEALCERARAGVRVTIVMDAIGSFGAFRKSAKPLEAAGCRVAAYQRFTWYRLGRLNNRTHRELLVVDGRVAFAGGAGVADWWAEPMHGKPMWRDMMARIEGPLVARIQGVLAENWLECCGEIMTGPETYKPHQPAGDVAGVRDQELAVGSIDGVAGAVPDAGRRRERERADLDAVLPAGQGVSRGDPPHRQPRRRLRGHRPRQPHRSAVGAAREPAHVRPAARGRRPDVRVRGRA